jgi:5-formyltetrahydrofolate cyclo-ligase
VDRATHRLVLHHVANLARDLTPGVLGIPEPLPRCPILDPRAIDWALVPGLAFDARGFRLGRGAGHYDRLLPQLRVEAPRWAAALSPQWLEDLPIEPHDQPLDGILGAERTYVDSRVSAGFSGDFD